MSFDSWIQGPGVKQRLPLYSRYCNMFSWTLCMYFELYLNAFAGRPSPPNLDSPAITMTYQRYRAENNSRKWEFRVKLSWSQPLYSGGSPIIRYRMGCKRKDYVRWSYESVHPPHTAGSSACFLVNPYTQPNNFSLTFLVRVFADNNFGSTSSTLLELYTTVTNGTGAVSLEYETVPYVITTRTRPSASGSVDVMPIGRRLTDSAE